jgi:hypothetical protein
VPWLPRIGLAAVLLIALAVGGPYAWNAAMTLKSRSAVKQPAPKAPPPATPRRALGTLHVTSTPPGARVLVDGKPRGVTPVTLDDVSVGRHTIELRSDAGTVQRTVTVAADKTIDVDAPIFSGWVGVYSPFEVVVSEAGRELRLDEHNQIMLAPGRHELRVSNRALGYESTHVADVKPGEVAKLAITPQPSSLNVTATEPAEVWVDGARVGETPLASRPIALGTHEIVVRRLTGGERRFTVTITVNPFMLNVDFSQG